MPKIGASLLAMRVSSTSTQFPTSQLCPVTMAALFLFNLPMNMDHKPHHPDYMYINGFNLFLFFVKYPLPAQMTKVRENRPDVFIKETC